MKLYPEMFFSVWHLAVPVLVFIAFIALIVGGYDRRTILRSSGSSLLIFYFIVTIPVGLFTQENMYQKEKMVEGLDQRYEEVKGKIPNDADLDSYIAGHVGAFQDDDDVRVVVYAGNYHENESFSGSLYVEVVDMDGNEVFTEIYDNITLKPGEKKKIDSTITSKPMDTYRYNFNAQSR